MFSCVLCKHLPTTYKNIRVRKSEKMNTEGSKKEESRDSVVPTGASRPFKAAAVCRGCTVAQCKAGGRVFIYYPNRLLAVGNPREED